MVVGTVLPPLSGLTWIKGGPLALDSPNVGVLVLEFWATWCPPCRDTIPHLTQLQASYSSKEVHVVGITTENDFQKVKSFVDGMGSKMDYTVAMDTSGSAQQLMSRAGARGIPHAFIVDMSKKIVFSGHPAEPSFDSALREAASQAPARGPGGAGAAGGAEKAALPLVKDTYEELMQLSAKELKEILKDRGIGFADCFEKSDLARKVVDRCANVVYYK